MAEAIQRTDLAKWSAMQVREAIRSGRWRGTTHGGARGRLQANLVVLSKDHAFDFFRFCIYNPKPCPILDVTAIGNSEPKFAAPGADVRTDLSKYRIFKNGSFVKEVDDLLDVWRDDDHVGFLLGCSLSFEDALESNGIPLPHLRDLSRTNCVYQTNIPCVPAGLFKGRLVVSMRAIPNDKVERAVEITGRYPLAHGAPVHIGDPHEIGIDDMNDTISGKFQSLDRGETAVFWACGVTPQSVAMSAGIPEMFTHKAGHMFVSDLALDGRK